MSNEIKNPDEVKKEIVRLMVAGESIIQICEREDMPARATVYRWQMNDTEFRMAYADALSASANELIKQSLEIADKEKRTPVELATDRLRIATRLKLAAML